jgi:hypothetical protein
MATKNQITHISSRIHAKCIKIWYYHPKIPVKTLIMQFGATKNPIAHT